MWWSVFRTTRRAAVALGGSTVCGTVALSSFPATKPRKEIPRIASSVSSPHLPTTVLVHGLDSSKQTWSAVLAELTAQGYPAVAIDLRGHGEYYSYKESRVLLLGNHTVAHTCISLRLQSFFELWIKSVSDDRSDLGDVADFAPEALARDVVRAVEQDLSIARPWVLVGHSMGGRVAMRVAAIAALEAPDMLAAVVVEDMDAVVRPTDDLHGQSDAVGFDRRFASADEARAALVRHGYAPDRVLAWLGARVRRLPDGSWWSDVNPDAKRFARERVLGSADADRAWTVLESVCRQRASGDETAATSPSLPFDVHLWVAADAETCCHWAGPRSVSNLQDRLPGTSVARFDAAGHSIHNTARPEFVAHLIGVINHAARTKLLLGNDAPRPPPPR